MHMSLQYDDFLKKFIHLIYLFLAALGLRCRAQAFPSCGKWGPLSLAWVSHCRSLSCRGAQAPGTQASAVVAHRFTSCGTRCSAACRILPDQGSNPCPPHWQADSQPLHHQGNPTIWWLLINAYTQVIHTFRHKTFSSPKKVFSCPSAVHTPTPLLE